MPGTDEPVLTTDAAVQSDVVLAAKAAPRAHNIKEFKSVLRCAGLLSFPNGVAIQSRINVRASQKVLLEGFTSIGCARAVNKLMKKLL